MTDWAAGITTAPRKKPTLQRSLNSIRAAGWDSPRIFADGDCPVPEGFEVTRRLPAAGAFSNWFLGLHELIQRNPIAKWYALFQDDVVLCKGAREAVETSGLPGVVSLFQADHYPSREIKRFTRGKFFVGGQALVFNRDVAHSLAFSRFGINHRLRKFRNNDYIDGGVGGWCQENDVPLWIYGPSLADHTGETSTLGHKEGRSKTFVGEHFDASAAKTKELFGNNFVIC